MRGILIDYCERNGLAFLPWFPLGGTSNEIDDFTEVQIVAKQQGVHVREIALAWLLHRSPAMLVIPGTSSIEHLENNVACAEIRFTEEEEVRLGLRTW